jgi:glycerol-3-phosphate acyltransferase PlsY
MEWVKLGVLIVGSYLLGAIPWGLMVSLRLGRDLRQHGSGKTGATNTLRVIGRRAAAVVFILDAAKGIFPVLIARALPWPDDTWLGVAMGGAAVAAIVGHCWSIWNRLFSGKWGGGRGVATAVGVMIMVHPLAALIGFVAGMGVILIWRYVSLGSIVGVSVGLLCVAVLAFTQQIPLWFFPWAVAAGLLVVVLHRDNIQRLLNGTERKLGQRA